MKIQKFNESFRDIFDHASIKITNNISELINYQDIKTINREGRKIYYINENFEIVELKRAYKLRVNQLKYNKLFPYLLIIKEKYMKEVITEKVKLIKEVYDLSKRKMETLFEIIRTISEENGI